MPYHPEGNVNSKLSTAQLLKEYFKTSEQTARWRGFFLSAGIYIRVCTSLPASWSCHRSALLKEAEGAINPPMRSVICWSGNMNYYWAVHGIWGFSIHFYLSCAWRITNPVWNDGLIVHVLCLDAGATLATAGLHGYGVMAFPFLKVVRSGARGGGSLRQRERKRKNWSFGCRA